MKLTCLLPAIALLLCLPLSAASREEAWKRVDDAAAKGLPQTAIKELDPIIGGALADRAWPEAIKAVTRKLAFEDEIQGGQAAGKIRRLEALIPQLPREMAPVLQTILADWYWSYFRMNRWRFAQRTATAVPPGADFESWDLPRLFAAIDLQFTKALAAERLLQTVPIATYDALLTRGTLPDAYRPTLYDFVVQEALEFYTAGEQAGALPEDAFEVDANGPALGTREEFLQWLPVAPAGAGNRVPPGLRAIQLYQALLRFHARDTDPTAAIDIDLARLLWAKNVAFGEEKGARFKAAMQAIATAYGDHELAAMALMHQATELRAEGDLAAAHEVATRARQIQPQSAGGRQAANLLAEIEGPSASVTTERIWNRPWPTIRVRYRNVDQVHFRLFAANWDDYLDRKRSRPESLRDDERTELLARPVVRRWSAPLPATADYRERDFEVPVPEDLAPGFYFLAASHKEDFSEAKNQLSLTDVWVSDLALVLRPDAAELGGFVLEAGSGEPLAGARVQAWYLNRQGERVAVPEVATDALGAFTLPLANQRNYVVKATARGQSVAARDQFSGWYTAPRSGAAERTLIFVDRAIYRPGQTVQYKGVCYRADQANDAYTVQAGRTLTIVFTDTNQKEIARQRHVANAYGSFSGSFTAPRDRLPGQMQLRIVEGPIGQTMVSVEEYKRPKFEVILDAPAAGGKLDEKVQLTGHAVSYTGAVVDGAMVKYRVVRAVRWPWWWGWHGFRRGGPGRGESQEITHGTARTAADGSFTVEFVAKPDRQVPAEDEPTFVFEVYADVTDSAGETRSESREVRLGYSAIEARLTADEWQSADRPVELRVLTTTLDGEPQAAEGIVRVLALKAPERVIRPRLDGGDNPVPFEVATDGAVSPASDPSDAAAWETASVVVEQGFTTDATGRATVKATLPVGAFRAVLECQDRAGRKVTGRLLLTVVQPAANRLGIPIPNHVGAPAWEVEPGAEFTALWGTGYERGRAYIEVEHRGKVLQRFWTPAEATQVMVRQAVTEGMRGGFALHVFQVRENRAYLRSQRVEVPWSNKELTLQWEHFTSKLQPGQKETWSLVIKPKVADAAATNAGLPELVATLYDRSLDAFLPHVWPAGFNAFREESIRRPATFANGLAALAVFRQDWAVAQEAVDATYRALPPELAELAGPARPMMMMRSATAARGAVMEGMVVYSPKPATPDTAGGINPELALPMKGKVGLASAAREEPLVVTGSNLAAAPTAPVDLGSISARRNLTETAFFYPQLIADASGVIRLTFTLPEALTEWRFLGFAHDRALRAGLIEGKAKAVKDLMVQPNPPRFLREGDTVEFAVKVSNLSDQPQRGRARLNFTDGFAGKSADALLGNRDVERPFELAPKASTTVTWRLAVPEGLATVSYKAVAAAAGGSDGEEGWLPVLSRRVLITESLPLPIVGPATNRFEFTRLLEAGKSKTLRHQGLTLQMVSNPAWYAVLALPYLMEYPHECSEQTFNRFYANAVARLVAHADPRIRRVFDQWKATPALESPLNRNPELKSVLLEESPWLREAAAESEARRNVGVLFDDNRLTLEQDQTWQRVKALQLPDGAWPWFPGGPANDYVTLYLVTGMGRLRQLGVDLELAPALKALDHLDGWIDETHRDILKRQTTAGSSHLTPTIALYLYGRSFFLRDKPIAPAHQAAIDYFLDQARRYAIPMAVRQSQAHVALALHRWGDAETPAAILKSLKEKSVVSDELGRSWREVGASWGWQDAPIETQATLIEAFDEIAHDAAVVDGCQVWLLKQKQTQDWRTTKATADAVYALLRRGRNPLAADQLVEVELGGTPVGPSPARFEPNAKAKSPAAPATTPEPGTGYYERHWSGAEIKPALGKVTTRKRDRGVAWGSLHWQYLEDLDKVTPARNTPLKLSKQVLVRRNTINGPVLEPINGPVAVGDELVVRIELRLDRNMEFVHLKDQRGSGTEPVNVLSGYKYQDGLGYYEATRDTASHFFFDRLPEGVHVIEYALRVQLRGEYGAGVATAQCMYAPEFNSHSASVTLMVR